MPGCTPSPGDTGPAWDWLYVGLPYYLAKDQRWQPFDARVE